MPVIELEFRPNVPYVGNLTLASISRCGKSDARRRLAMVATMAGASRDLDWWRQRSYLTVRQSATGQGALLSAFHRIEFGCRR
jgi:hypothetical protein